MTKWKGEKGQRETEKKWNRAKLFGCLSDSYDVASVKAMYEKSKAKKK